MTKYKINTLYNFGESTLTIIYADSVINIRIFFQTGMSKIGLLMTSQWDHILPPCRKMSPSRRHIRNHDLQYWSFSSSQMCSTSHIKVYRFREIQKLSLKNADTKVRLSWWRNKIIRISGNHSKDQMIAYQLWCHNFSARSKAYSRRIHFKT